MNNALPVQDTDQHIERIRASMTPIIAKCRASYPLLRDLFWGGEEANAGKAFHKVMELHLMKQPIDWDYISTYYGLAEEDTEDIRIAYFWTLKNVSFEFPITAQMFIEEQLYSDFLPLSGRPDVFWYEPPYIHFVDWKSGYKDVESPMYNLQMKAYAFMLWERYPDVEGISCSIVQPRLQQVKTGSWERGEIKGFAEAFQQIIDECLDVENAEFTTGAHCSDCYACMMCPAFAGEIQTFSQLLGGIDGEDDDLETALRKTLPVAKAAKTVANKIESVAKTFVDQFGPLRLNETKVYAKREKDQEKVNPEKALGKLGEIFGRDVMQCISISKKSISDLAKSTDKIDVSLLLELLRGIGAISSEKQFRYEEVKR
ncbi:MAG: DUF2800 domain-containing protein [Candidatus Auribacterota bacterium]